MSLSENKKAWLILRLVPEMTRVRYYTLIDHFQSPELVLGASAKEIASLRGFDRDLARAVLEGARTVPIDEEIRLMEDHETRLLTLDDQEYPRNLKQSSFPPPIIFVRGTLDDNDRFSVAMVGSRHATQYGKAVAQQFAGRLAAAGLTIVSGFARGVDSQAHQAALSVGGRTIGVLGNGQAVCYPAENRNLAIRIVKQGALISEYPMNTPPDRYNFPERNHLIAAMSLGTIVVEAAEKSGALITANDALDENRFVFAIPGDINRSNSRGTNTLIQNGARLVQRPDDVLHEMKDLLRGYLRENESPIATQAEDKADGKVAGENNGAGIQDNASAATSQAPTAVKKPQLSPEEQKVLMLIQHEPAHFDVLLSRLDEEIPVQKLSTLLLGLEMKRAIRQLPGRLYVVME